MWRITVSVVLLAMFCSGCNYSEKRMDPEVARNIRTIALLDVAADKGGGYLDMGAGVLAGGGLFGLAVHEVATADAREQAEKALGAMDMSRIVAEEMEASLLRRGFAVRRIPDGTRSYREGSEKFGGHYFKEGLFVKNYAAIPVAGCDAILDALCLTVGYARYPFTQSDHPYMIMGARLVSPDGQQVHYVRLMPFGIDWEYHSVIDADRSQFKASWSEVFSNPKLLEQQLRIAARAICDSMTADIAAKPN